MAWTGATAHSAEALDREIQTPARALDEHGPTDQKDLARLVGARY